MSAANRGTVTAVGFDDAGFTVNWIPITAFVLIAIAAVAALALTVYRRSRRPTKRRMTITQEDSRPTQVGELRAAQKRAADLEEIVEDLIMVIGPGAGTLLWNLRAARAEEDPDHESTFNPESLTTQIEGLSAQLRTFETAAGEAIEPSPSASAEPASVVPPTEEPLESMSAGPATGPEDDAPEPTTAPDTPAVIVVSPTLHPLHVDPAACAASPPAVDLALDTERPIQVERDDEGSTLGEEARWLRFALARSDTTSNEPPTPVEPVEESSTSRSSTNPEEVTMIDPPVVIELRRADDTPLVVDLSEWTRPDANPSRTER